jgi:ribokinase
MTTRPGPRIAAVGLAGWERFLVVGRYPRAGEYVVVDTDASLPGGTTANSAVALARIGARVSLAALVGDDTEGEALRAALAAQPGIDTGWLATRPAARTDASTIVVSGEPPERTIYWHRGAELVRRDRLDITAIFDHDLVLLDIADAPLRRWLTDLPAHFAPRTRLLGTMTYLVEAGEPDALEIGLRFDALVGNSREVLALTGAPDLDTACSVMTTMMRGANLRALVVSRGAEGCRVCTADEAWDVPGFAVEAVDPTGAGDAFAAGIAYGMARRWDWPRAARLANALGALATRALGAQASLPTRAEVAALLEEDEAAAFA